MQPWETHPPVPLHRDWPNLISSGRSAVTRLASPSPAAATSPHCTIRDVPSQPNVTGRAEPTNAYPTLCDYPSRSASPRVFPTRRTQSRQVFPYRCDEPVLHPTCLAAPPRRSVPCRLLPQLPTPRRRDYPSRTAPIPAYPPRRAWPRRDNSATSRDGSQHAFPMRQLSPAHTNPSHRDKPRRHPTKHHVTTRTKPLRQASPDLYVPNRSTATIRTNSGIIIVTHQFSRHRPTPTISTQPDPTQSDGPSWSPTKLPCPSRHAGPPHAGPGHRD